MKTILVFTFLLLISACSTFQRSGKIKFQRTNSELKSDTKSPDNSNIETVQNTNFQERIVVNDESSKNFHEETKITQETTSKIDRVELDKTATIKAYTSSDVRNVFSEKPSDDEPLDTKENRNNSSIRGLLVALATIFGFVIGGAGILVVWFSGFNIIISLFLAYLCIYIPLLLFILATRYKTGKTYRLNPFMLTAIISALIAIPVFLLTLSMI